ncbi:MAG TPA: ATP-binding cassette domain-containing protein [Gaiellaceae bacterium]|jgi:ABC-type lipoprotein export system ATPase subunit
MTPAIDVREAFRIHRFGGATSVALQGLSLQVEQGEIVVVLGPSGSGKTTLLRTVAAFDTLSAGSAGVLGIDVGSLGPGAAAMFRARNLGLLDQHYARALSPDLTCVHTVGLGLELLGSSRAEARAVAAGLLERVGLGDRLDARPGSLSGGEQQRVALCAALAHRPRLLLADEPAGELDAENAKVVYDLIAELAREQGTTALVVSHDEAAATIADRLVYVRDGRVVEEGRPGTRSSLVVTEPGWVRLPDPLLEALGSPTRLHAERREHELVLSNDELDRTLELPAPAMFHEHAARPGGVVAELRRVVKRFAGAARPVLSDVTASFAGGTLTAVVGRSGSGKTTLLHLLAGLDRPSEGEVLVQGLELETMSRSESAAVRREHVALITQEPGLVPHLSARENVELGLLVRGAEGDTDAAAAAALTEVGLGARLDHRADRLSAGERQRVAIARALAAGPVLLLADEPTARLDQSNARAVGELLAKLAHEHGTAVVCATHDAVVIEQADAQLALASEQPARTAAARQ